MHQCCSQRHWLVSFHCTRICIFQTYSDFLREAEGRKEKKPKQSNSVLNADWNFKLLAGTKWLTTNNCHVSQLLSCLQCKNVTVGGSCWPKHSVPVFQLFFIMSPCKFTRILFLKDSENNLHEGPNCAPFLLVLVENNATVVNQLHVKAATCASGCHHWLVHSERRAEHFTQQAGDDRQQARPGSDLQHSLVHQTHLLLVVLQELAQGYGLQRKSPLSLTFTAVNRQRAAVGTYRRPDQSAVSVYRFADVDVVAGEMKRFASLGEVDAGLPDGPPDKSLSCHHSLACRHWRGGGGGEWDTDTVLMMLRPSA